MSDPAKPIDEEEREIEQKMIKVIKMMPEAVQPRFKVLKVLSDKRQKLNEQFEEEMRLLNEKIEAKKKPLYDKRRNIIDGEITDFSEYVPKYEAAVDKLENEYEEVKSKQPEGGDGEEGGMPDVDPQPVDVTDLDGKDGIPNFWSKAILNCRMISEMIKPKDEEILKFLKNVEVEQKEKPEKLTTIKMQFADNEFFDNSEISFTLKYDAKGGEQVKEIEGSDINWQEGKNPCEKKVKKKQKHKKTNETRTIVKTVPAESFFNVFKSRVAPDEEADMEDEENEAAMEAIDMATQLAEDICDDFYPNALDYYLNIVDDDDFGDEDDYGSEGGSGSDQGSDGDDDDQPKKSKKGGKKKGAEGGKPPADKDCKQQ